MTGQPIEVLAPLTCPAEPPSIVVRARVNTNEEPGLDEMLIQRFSLQWPRGSSLICGPFFDVTPPLSHSTILSIL